MKHIKNNKKNIYNNQKKKKWKIIQTQMKDYIKNNVLKKMNKK